MENKKIGLVLSGGGHRAAAHAGALKAMEEHGIFPDIISGTGAGALVGALYAANHSPDDILAAFKEVEIFNFARHDPNFQNIIDTDLFCDMLQGYLPEDSFEALDKKVLVTTTDLLHGCVKVFEEGPLIKVLLASISFPGLFQPVDLDNSLYIDGCILDNFPVEPIHGKCDVIYGVYVSPVAKMEFSDFKHTYTILDRAFQLPMNRNAKEKFPLCDVLIYPHQLGNHSLFDAQHLNTIFEIGYKTTLQELKRRKAQINFLKMKS
ncbi:patatin [Flavobacteriaceae bacterium TP-CH-4]|uniref:Patatin n=1 Tax=Pelagihabitans pacificus TaxID=2696054 RepID=A0A967ASL1_9FLAO|nr:patatin-like phospholipase family protein [Pelagihabitans pacificus]NHF59594.1 patatin [Pelagihabitans pacificus]